MNRQAKSRTQQKQNYNKIETKRQTNLWMSFFWASKHSRMHSLQNTWPLGHDRGSMRGFKQRQQASKGLMESLPRRSLWVPYPNFRFSSYVKKARSLLFFECLCGILSPFVRYLTPEQNPNPNPNCQSAWSTIEGRTTEIAEVEEN